MICDHLLWRLSCATGLFAEEIFQSIFQAKRELLLCELCLRRSKALLPILGRLRAEERCTLARALRSEVDKVVDDLSSENVSRLNIGDFMVVQLDTGCAGQC